MSDYIYPLNNRTFVRGFDPPTHYGIDWSAPTNTPIYASNTGTIVTYLLNAPSGSGYGGYGNVIQLQHDDGLFTMYAHCNTLYVKSGRVQRGQQIAGVGSTGDSTGSHLHFEISTSKLPTDHQQVDPMIYLEGASDPINVPSNWIYGNRALTESEYTQNALKVIDFFMREGWTLNAVCGMLGNMVAESTVNPSRWESDTPFSGGYGLVQWTPYTNYSNWAGIFWQNNGDKECERIQYELENGLQFYATENYNISFREFSTSLETPEYLASAFLYNYERPTDPTATEAFRRERARYFYNLYNGYYPSAETNPSPWKSKSKFIYPPKRRLLF